MFGYTQLYEIHFYIRTISPSHMASYQQVLGLSLNFSEMFKDAADDAHKKENGFEIDKALISRLASRASDIAAVEFDRGSSRVSQVLTHGNRR